MYVVIYFIPFITQSSCFLYNFYFMWFAAFLEVSHPLKSSYSCWPSCARQTATMPIPAVHTVIAIALGQDCGLFTFITTCHRIVCAIIVSILTTIASRAPLKLLTVVDIRTIAFVINVAASVRIYFVW